MRNWFLKNFFRSKVVRVFVLDENGRLDESYEFIKKPLTVTIKKRGQTFILSHEAVMISTKDNIPTYLLSYKNAEPMDLHNYPKTHYTMSDFDTAIDHNTVSELYKTTKGGFMADANILVLVVIVCSMFLLGYYLNGRLNKIENTITPEPTPVVEVEEGF